MDSTPTPDRSRALRILQHSAAFQTVQAKDLECFAPRLRQLEAGQVLFAQGDAADLAYVVEAGILGLYDHPSPRSSGGSPARPFRKVVAGELVGEYGLLCDQPRSATGLALTSCTLLELEPALLESLLGNRPQIQTRLLRQIAEAASVGRRADRQLVRSAAVLNLQPQAAATQACIAALRQELGRNGGDPITLMSPDSEEDCHQRLIAMANGDAMGLLLLNNAALLSARNRQLIDRLATLQLGDSPVAPPLPAVDLAVHLWPAGTERPHGSRCQGAEQILHICPEHSSEIGRLARMLLARATVLVLGGGGARGFAHIGAIAAIEELGQPAIDMVLGVSVGSLVGSLLAFRLPAARILSELERVIIRSRPYSLKLPDDSLFSLKNSRRALQEFFGPSTLEDAWLPFQAFSANLSRKQLQGWRRGSIPDAVIASMSVPGIFSPCRDPHGDLHVDGGILCNLPIQQARQLTDGLVIAISLDAPASSHTGTAKPSLAGTIINAMMCSSHAAGLSQEPLADVVLRPEISDYAFLEWKRYREIYAAGHRAALQALGPR